MITKESMNTMTAEQVMDLLTKSKKQHAAAIERANTAVREYDRAVRDRNTKIREMTADLNKRLAEVEYKEEALKPAMLKATMLGGDVELDKVQRTLTELEQQRTQLGAQLELLSGKPPRCDEAYTAMETAVAESKEADEQYYADLKAIREFCEQAIAPWNDILSAIRERGVSVSRFFLDRARSHYSSER